MIFKDDSIRLDHLRPQLVLGLVIAESVHRRHSSDQMVITSVNDSAHMEGSLHYTGRAADLRSWYYADAEEVALEMREALRKHFDVVLENDHIHIEYDPKAPIGR